MYIYVVSCSSLLGRSDFLHISNLHSFFLTENIVLKHKLKKCSF